MSKPKPTDNDDALIKSLAAEARGRYEAMLRSSVDAMIELGRELQKIRDRTPHGAWEKLVRVACIPPRTASRALSYFRHRKLLRDLSPKNIRTADAVLRDALSDAQEEIRPPDTRTIEVACPKPLPDAGVSADMLQDAEAEQDRDPALPAAEAEDHEAEDDGQPDAPHGDGAGSPVLDLDAYRANAASSAPQPARSAPYVPASVRRSKPDKEALAFAADFSAAWREVDGALRKLTDVAHRFRNADDLERLTHLLERLNKALDGLH